MYILTARRSWNIDVASKPGELGLSVSMPPDVSVETAQAPTFSLDPFHWNRQLLNLVAAAAREPVPSHITLMIMAHVACVNIGSMSRYLDEDPKKRMPMHRAIYDAIERWNRDGCPNGKFWLLPQKWRGNTMWYGERGDLCAFRRMMDRWVGKNPPLTLDEAAAILGVSQSLIYYWYWGDVAVPQAAVDNLTAARMDRNFKLPYAITKTARWEAARILAQRS